ncbi:hypothetical protein SAMN05421810_110186 [Amycolatopsis arida]|uniref:Pimeloyl-ACP methyl ester carboxylesterase n=1 Tax=Amycolatopsis arida TaxID=587909 RepID=A0A1I5ZWU0_9PSEU|nr:alpha/beta hydrolase [Amycolatopsis arida]TDX89419.1 hypothetical protein CLV69_110187 [Amycolatopsis arida]SFQ60803.1 hypothetical protein SAMN05421810_110186 [Amycolatopsis arida]
MSSVIPARQAVVLPGTGSDEVFARAVFEGPLRAVGLRAVAPPPPAGAALVTGSLAVLDELAAAAGEPIVVGGISLGAHLATEWAVRNPRRCAGVLAALPAWIGRRADAPAAVAARASADLVDRHGVSAALALATDGVPDWLAAELRRAWKRHGTGLAASLRAAAAHPAPLATALAALRVPVGIAACGDDPVHPAATAYAWARALPRATVRETTLVALGRDPESLGRAAVLAWLQARASA